MGEMGIEKKERKINTTSLIDFLEGYKCSWYC